MSRCVVMPMLPELRRAGVLISERARGELAPILAGQGIMAVLGTGAALLVDQCVGCGWTAGAWGGR